MKSMKPDLNVTIGGIEMKNPVMCASGTFGFGEEYARFFDPGLMGALVTKTITLKPREGNPPPRTKETPSGMLNSIGLQNPGIEGFVRQKLPFLRKFRVPVIVSIAGENSEEYVELAKELGRVRGISGIEMNISCPNVSSKKLFSQDKDSTYSVVRKVCRVSKIPVIAKLSPNVTDIAEIARAAERGGADAVSLINTITGMAVDLSRKRPFLSTVTGGLSGPAIKPVALRMVWEVYNAVKVPVIGMGGIMNANDALEFMITGASAVAVGTANFINPLAIPQIIEGIEKYLVRNNIKSINSITGTLKIG